MSKPTAVCALLLSPDSTHILAVTRKTDHTDWGLPGGKIESGETPEQACIRELQEETGCYALRLEHVFTGPDEGGHVVSTYWVSSWTGVRSQTEAGKVAWVPLTEVLFGSFGRYNEALFNSVGIKLRAPKPSPAP